MEIIDAINSRYSVRAFKPDPVPKHILEELLTVAQRSPSWANTQTWEFAVAGGEVVEDLRKTLAARAFAQDADLGPPTPRRPAPAPMTGTVPMATATDAEIGKTCPYCRFPIKIGAPVVVCDACKTPHHQDCWQENGGCTSYGCARAPGARPQPVATAAGFPAAATVGPHRSAGSAIADALILAELDRSAGNALTYAIVGIFCCQIFSIVGMLMGFSALSSINRSGLPAPGARTKAIIAIVIGVGTILLVLVGLLVQAQGGFRYQ